MEFDLPDVDSPSNSNDATDSSSSMFNEALSSSSSMFNEASSSSSSMFNEAADDDAPDMDDEDTTEGVEEWPVKSTYESRGDESAQLWNCFDKIAVCLMNEGYELMYFERCYGNKVFLVFFKKFVVIFRSYFSVTETRSLSHISSLCNAL
jgi:hypothetical protein